MNATESKIASPVIPAHPEWCDGPLGDAEHCSTDPFHRSYALHLDVDSFAVGFAVTLAQSDEYLGDARHVGAPHLEFTMKNRDTDDFAWCGLTEDETVRLIAMLQRRLEDLRNVKAIATSEVFTEEARLDVTLGWTPDTA